MRNSKLYKVVLGVAALALGAAACSPASSAATPSAQVPVVADNAAVIAEGRVEPGSFAELSFITGGQVAEVLVKEGDLVKAGDVLARLKNREALKAQATQAEQAVLDATQAIKTLNDNAALAEAQAQQDVAQGQSDLDKAQRRVKNLVNPDLKFYQDELKKAQDALATAQENAQITSIGDLQVALKAAQDRLKKATDVYNDAQKTQADCPGCERVFAVSIGAYVKLEDAKKEFTDATDAVKVLQLRIDQAQRGDTQAIKDLKKRVDDAQANYDQAKNPKPTDVALAQADAALIQARLEDAQTRVTKLKAGPDPDQLAAAQARLATAQANLAAAQAAVADTELRAPIAGTVADLKLKVGEQAVPGQAVVTLADFSRWVVKTRNLTEIEVVRVKTSQAAEVALDALPGVKLNGKVTSIGQVYVEVNSNINYVVAVELAQPDARLRWGMTAQVTLTP